MGYGPIVNGKQQPITPWKGSWAESMDRTRVCCRCGREGHLSKDCKWPLILQRKHT